ncbi:MAG: thymidylate synthase [Pseudomonadota bacterium]|nr:thymidylate synthase [Pseudomonadota bacterium]
MYSYLDLLKDIKNHGRLRQDRTGTGTYSVFGRELRFDLSLGLPVVTTKRVHLKSVIIELLWFIRGEGNIAYLKENGVRIWDEWASETGDLGPVYGCQWRAWKNADGVIIDQLAQLLHNLVHDPYSRRHILQAWNVGELSKMALPPCHVMSQFYIADGRLSCKLTQRSADVFLGLPFNIVSYSLLTHMLAQQCGYQVGDIICSVGDCHIYTNHLEAVETQLKRSPYPIPQFSFARKPSSIDDYKLEDFIVENYTHHPTIKAPIAV